MEFWELLFFVDLIGMIVLLIMGIIRVWGVAQKERKFTNEERSEFSKWNFILLILNIITFGIGMFTFIRNNTELLLLSLIQMIIGMFVLNILFFVIQWIFTLKDQAVENIEAYDPSKFNLSSFGK